MRLPTRRGNPAKYGTAARNWYKLFGNVCRENSWSGIGLFGTSTKVVRDNICQANQRHGIVTGEQAVLEVIGNTCHENSLSDIGLFDMISGVVRGNACQWNHKHGIVTGGQIVPD